MGKRKKKTETKEEVAPEPEKGIWMSENERDALVNALIKSVTTVVAGVLHQFAAKRPVVQKAVKRKARRPELTLPDGNKLKQPLSAYLLFKEAERKRDPDIGKRATCLKEIAKRWNELTPEAKEPYENEASTLQNAYYASKKKCLEEAQDVEEVPSPRSKKPKTNEENPGPVQT